MLGQELHVVDMSPCIYAGSYNVHSMIPADVVKTAEGWRERYIPTGGASMLFNIIGMYSGRGDIAFVADRLPSIKLEMYPRYKSNRTHREEISIHKDVAEYILKDCGYTIHYRDGYEADDVIANIVDQYHDQYEHIFVHTADSDLYILVDDKVSILPTSSRAKTVTRANYESIISSKGFTLYNTVVFAKFLRGDPGKDIAGMSQHDQEYMWEHMLVMKEHMGNWKLMRSYFQRWYPQMYDRLQLFYPLPIEDKFDIANQENILKIKAWAHAIGNRKVPGKEGDLTNQVAELLSMNLYLDE